MNNFTKAEYEKNLKEQITYSRKQEQAENAEAAIYSTILLTTIIIIIGSLTSIYNSLFGG